MDLAANTIAHELTAGKIICTDSVLIADDDTVSRTMLESRLRKWDLSVVTAKDGLYAWHELQKETAPNLIILDWMMPGISGVDLCRRIRARTTGNYPYILLLSSRDAKQDLVEALDAGADDYLTKPFDPNELRSRLTVGVRILNLQNQLLRKEEELNFQAWHDSLTSLWNRGAIMGFLDSELARVHRTGCSVGVLMVDIDHFKKVNDVHGHPTGDAVLREVAQRLASCTRAYDWVGRYGGEEFMVVLSNCDPEAIATCAERLRATVAAGPVFAHGCELPITVSVGAALYSRELAERGADALALADAALYRAKAAGRNRVEMA